MPRNVRNYWVDVDIDGRSSTLSGGPTNRTGGFNLTIRMRDDGSISRVVDIIGRADDAGNLRLIVTTCTGEHLTIETKR